MSGFFNPDRPATPGLVVLSGLDGTGKSTQARILAEGLRENGIRSATIWNRWEPKLTGPIVSLARRVISRSSDAPTADYERFTAGKRRRMRSPFRRALWQAMVWGEYAGQVHGRLRRAGIGRGVVVCDRFVYDTLVDIAINFSLGPDELDRITGHPFLSLFPRPQLVFIIDIDPETGARRKSDGTPPAYLADRRPLYLAVAKRANAIVVDGNRSIDEVAAAIREGSQEMISSLPDRFAYGKERT